jgi:hypothetical protein
MLDIAGQRSHDVVSGCGRRSNQDERVDTISTELGGARDEAPHRVPHDRSGRDLQIIQWSLLHQVKSNASRKLHTCLRRLNEDRR